MVATTQSEAPITPAPEITAEAALKLHLKFLASLTPYWTYQIAGDYAVLVEAYRVSRLVLRGRLTPAEQDEFFGGWKGKGVNPLDTH